MNNLYIKFSLIIFFFCSLSGSLLGQTHNVNLIHPTTVTGTDGQIDVSWTYSDYSVRVKLNSNTDSSSPFLFKNLPVGDYIVTYQYYYKWGKDKGWRDYASQKVTLVAGGGRISCIPSIANYNRSNNEYISNVVIGDIDNDSNSNGYTDYTDSQSTNVEIGKDYLLTITNGRYDDDAYGIWVDWNQDGDFDDIDETIVSESGDEIYVVTITPPSHASIGNSRMRIRVSFLDPASACEDTNWGEIEDYTLNVISNPKPEITDFTPKTACENGEIVITGKNFTSSTSVQLDNLAIPSGNIAVDNNSQITVKIPNGATTGLLKVINAGKFSESSTSLTIKEPLILSANVINDDCGFGDDGAIDLTVDAGISASLDFASTNEPVDLGDSFLSGLRQFTLEGWVKFTTSMATGQHSFFGQNNVIEFGFENGVLTCWVGINKNVKYTVASFPSDGEWHHVAAVGNGKDLILYIDGLEVKKQNHSSNSVSSYGSSAYTVMIGAGVWDNKRTNDPFKGEISVVRFWEIARSDDQILDGRFVKLTGAEAGLLAAYRLDEAVGTSLTGVGPKAKTITFSNEILWNDNPISDSYTYAWTKQGDASFSETKEDLNKLAIGTYDVTVSVPGCSASDSYVVDLITENENPVAICQDISIFLDDKGLATITPQMINKGSTDNCGITKYSLDKLEFSSVGNKTVRLTVTDASGNSSFCDAIVKVGAYVEPPNSADCLGAITICDAFYDEPSPEINGQGNVLNELPSGDCIPGEKNGIWYSFSPQNKADANLKFRITPNDGWDDYDWAIFDMTNVSCEDLAGIDIATSDVFVSGNTYGSGRWNGPVGADSNRGSGNCNGPGDRSGDKWNSDVRVKAGHHYVLYVSNWSESNSGYEISFDQGGTAIIYDNVPPDLNGVVQACYGANQLKVQFTEKIPCGSLNKNEIHVTIGSVTYNVVSIKSDNCDSGAEGSDLYFLELDRTITDIGSSNLKIEARGISDMCGNENSVVSNMPFSIVKLNPIGIFFE